MTHLQGSGCPKCSKNQSYTTNSFIKQANGVHGAQHLYTKVSYEKSDVPVLITCQKHGDFFQRPANHLIGQGCPKCRHSSGEDKISGILRSQNIKFETQFKMQKCKHIRMLPFDFALLNNGKIVGLIEFQGHFHFKPIKVSRKISDEMAQENLSKCQHRDRIKLNYCIGNSIPLLVIAYYDENIEETVKEFVREVYSGNETPKMQIL